MHIAWSGKFPELVVEPNEGKLSEERVTMHVLKILKQFMSLKMIADEDKFQKNI